MKERRKRKLRSWLDTLPPRPPAQPLGATLGPSAGVAVATCEGDGVIVTGPGPLAMPSSSVAHSGGRWYFEATVEQYEAGWSSVGVFAPPTGLIDIVASSHFDAGSAAGFSPTGLSTVSVAVDLEAGRVYFYVDGVLTSERSLTLLPGVGAFRAAGVAMTGNSIRFNFGSEPFEHGVPAGYEPWSGGDEDANGACISDSNGSAPPAPVTVICEQGEECAPTTFEAETRAPTDLVVLGVYDSGGVSSWRWGTDDNGNPIQVPTGEGRNGSIVVDVNRPGRVALVLTAYEPTDWTIRTGSRTQLASVSAYGMHQQTVTGLHAGVPLDIHTICADGNGGSCSVRTDEWFPIGAYQWPYSSGGGDTQGFVRHVEERLGLPLKLFAAAYKARGFVVE
ncbi:MAG TPA: hypothetical protein VI072_13285 [Polyangiaceae bacterium]